jgi:hypothetical protein
MLNRVEWHEDLLILFQLHHSAFANNTSKVQYAVVIEIMGPAMEQPLRSGVLRQVRSSAKVSYGISIRMA